MTIQTSLLTCLLLLGAGCAAEAPDDTGDDIGSGSGSGSGSGEDENGVVEPCEIAASLGSIDLAGAGPGLRFSNAVTFGALVLDDSFYLMVDLVQREETDPAPATGTFDLATQNNPTTCTTCVTLARRSDGVTFLPTTGTLTVDTLAVTTLPGQYAATASTITFGQLDFDGDGDITGGLLPGGCTTQIDGFTFDVTVVEPEPEDM